MGGVFKRTSLREHYGLHRVLEPEGAMPQAAQRLDNRPHRLSAGELLIDVDTLNVDSASMRQLEQRHRTPSGVARAIQSIVRERGKLQNPVTGSGGMLLGEVISPGTSLGKSFGVGAGDSIATLVSLTLTPLHLDEIVSVDLERHQVKVRGTAVLFPSGVLAAMPDDMAPSLALALFDVAGAAPQMPRLVGRGDAVLVLGAGGKSGLLVSAAARRLVGSRGNVVGVEAIEAGATAAERVGACDRVLVADATDPIATAEAALAASPRARSRGGFDVVVSCVNAAGAEMAAIAAATDRGKVYFFGMATEFARAALGAEGCGRDVDLFIGNGYCQDHAAYTMDLVRNTPSLRAELERRFS